MLLGTDELTILRGSKFCGTWQWINSVTGDPESFAGLSASIKIKNIHEDFADVKNTYEVGTAIVEPLDVDNNIIPGRVDIELSKEETLLLAIPEGEDDRYGESDFYAILEILLSTGEVILQAKVRVVESLESETLNFLLDEKDEAIIIYGKLDNILLRNDEYISTRDNLIDVVIPTALSTYNTNHDEKMDIYNVNHTNKLDTYNSNDTSKTNIYNQNHASKLQEVNTLALDVQSNKDLVDQAKANVLAMKDDVQGNKESVALMKTAIETMLDNFDDRFLGLKDSDPLLDNDGNPLQIAAIYYNNPSKELRFYNGVSWDSPVAAAQTYALQASQYANDALVSKNAAKISEDNAKASELNAQTIVSQKVNITDIIDNLNSTLINKPLSANQGRILKNFIDSLNTLLLSNDTSLDTLQEVVAYIKANKNNLDALADVHSKTAKTTPVDADEFMIADSATTWSLKKITWANIVTKLKSLFNIDANGNIGSGTQSFNGFGGSGFKNYIINGKKVINQRALTSTDNNYNQDRWYKAGNNWFQGIESDNNLISGKKYTLSWVGTATASYYVGTATSSTINAQTFTPITNGGNFTLTITARQNLWIKFISDATGSTFNFVQLEEGSVATPFEQRPIGLELSLCQRYYIKWRHIGGAQNISTTQLQFTIAQLEYMRTLPTLTNAVSGDGSGYIFSTFGSSTSIQYFGANCCSTSGEGIITANVTGLITGLSSIAVVGSASAEL